MPKRKRKPSVTSTASLKNKNQKTLEMSHYEKRVLENKQRNQALLAELNIAQVQQDLHNVNRKKKLNTNTIKIKKTALENLPRRQSLRLRKLEPDGAMSLTTFEPSTSLIIEKPKRHPAKLEMVLANEANEEESIAFLSVFKGQAAKSTTKVPKRNNECASQSYKQLMETLQIKDHHVAKVVPERIVSTLFHSMENKVSLFAGDKRGALGVWDVDSQKKNRVYVYEPHTRAISNMVLDPLDCTKLVTCSYDGTIRCADFSKAVFNEVYALDDGEYFTYLCYGTNSSHTLLASTGDGEVIIVDTRKKGDSSSYQLHDNPIKCIDVHPQNANIFLTSTRNGIISIWDVRKLNSRSLHVSSIKRSRSVSSAFFSPITGQQILATGWDDCVTVTDVSQAGILSQTHSYHHNNNTGRWLSTFNAKWDPRNETCFAIGSLTFPRQIDIFSTDIKTGALTHLQHENLTTITSRIAFHPTLNLIAGANSSGKAFVWSE